MNTSIGLIGGRRRGKTHKLIELKYKLKRSILIDGLGQHKGYGIINCQSIIYPDKPSLIELIAEKIREGYQGYILTDETHLLIPEQQLQDFASLVGACRNIGIGIVYTSWRMYRFLTPSLRSVSDEIYLWELEEPMDKQFALKIYPSYSLLEKTPLCKCGVRHSYLHITDKGITLVKVGNVHK